MTKNIKGLNKSWFILVFIKSCGQVILSLARVTQAPQIKTKPHESVAAFPDIFRHGVVTRARTRTQLDVKCDETQLCDLSTADLPWPTCNWNLPSRTYWTWFVTLRRFAIFPTVSFKKSDIEEMGAPRKTFYRQPHLSSGCSTKSSSCGFLGDKTHHES